MLLQSQYQEASLQDAEPQPIEFFTAGKWVHICAVRGERQLCQRLESMGLLPGRRVQILKWQGKGLLLKLENTRLALRLSSAFVIDVLEVS